MTPDWVTLDECEDKYRSGYSEPYWHKNKFSWCRSKRLVTAIVEIPSLRPIADVFFTLTYIGQGYNGQRTLELQIELEDWSVIVHNGVKWDAVRPGLVYRFHPFCTALDSGSACGDIPPLGQTFAEFPAMTSAVRDYWYVPTTTTPWSGDTNPQDKKGYYRFIPLLQAVHLAGMTNPTSLNLPQDDLRCDSGSYGGSLGSGGCVFTNVTSYLQLDCNDGEIRESACFIKDAFEDITRTYPGQIGTYVPGQHGGPHEALTRNYYENGGVSRRSRTNVVNACVAGYGPDYTWRSDGQRNDCDEYPFLVTYQNANSSFGGRESGG